MSLTCSQTPPSARIASPSAVVIGAGIIGLAVARELAAAGHRVQVIERARHFGRASRAAGGMLAPLGEAREPGLFLELATASLGAYPDWVASLQSETGHDVGFRRCGKLIVALSEQDTLRLRARFEWMRDDGHDVAWLGRGEALEVEPAVHPQLSAALHLRSDAQVDNPKLHDALLASVIHRGGALLHPVEVRRITSTAGGVTGVELTDGTRIDAPLVVLAAGAWSASLDGLPQPLPVRPVKGQMLLLELERALLSGLVTTEHAYLIPRAIGSRPGLLVGASAEDAGFDESTHDDTLKALRAAAEAVVPALTEARVADRWAGLRPATPDALPVLGPDPALPGLIHANGHFRNGVLLAPITAAVIAHLVRDRAAAAHEGLPFDLTQLCPTRFAA